MSEWSNTDLSDVKGRKVCRLSKMMGDTVTISWPLSFLTDVTAVVPFKIDREAGNKDL